MFEDPQRRDGMERRRGRALAASALLHLAALLALVAAAARAPAAGGAERPIEVIFLRAAGGAAAAPPPAPVSAPERQAELDRQAMLDRLVQPTTVPDATPGEAARPAAPGGGAATNSGGAAAAHAGGTGTAAEDAPDGLADLPVAAGGEVVRPEVIESSRVAPVYPAEAVRARLEGLVVLKVVVDERGRVGDIEVVRGLGHGLDEAAVAAVRRWRFRPATRNGRPIKVFHVIPFDFRL